jgi:hypothetical protein
MSAVAFVTFGHLLPELHDKSSRDRERDRSNRRVRADVPRREAFAVPQASDATWQVQLC